MGLIAYGAATLLTWVLYTSINVGSHFVSLAVLCLLIVFAGLSADRLLTWLLNVRLAYLHGRFKPTGWLR